MKYCVVFFKFHGLFVFKSKQITPYISSIKTSRIFGKIAKLFLSKDTPIAIVDHFNNVVEWVNPWIVNNKSSQSDQYHDFQDDIMNMPYEDMFSQKKNHK